jgi:hypothetical protein
MKRNVTALYETREEADRVAVALKAQGLGDEVEIRDAKHEDAKRGQDGLGGWLSGIFGGHDDHRLYAEGLRRGHVLFIAKVDELNETRAALIMDAAAMNLGAVEATWRSEGWGPETADPKGRAHHHIQHSPLDTMSGAGASSPYASTFGGVRSYTL